MLLKDSLHSIASIFQTAKREISLHVLEKYKFYYVYNLVEYFQMEHRWSIRKSLIENFIMMCSLEPATMISLMLNSVLPLELAQDIYQSTKDVARMRHCALLLTAIFSSGE